MERMTIKSMVMVPHEQEHSFRSNRTTNQYNINDYLPPPISSLSRTSVFASRQKDKIYTEPNDRVNTVEVSEIKKKMEKHEEEKQNFRREIERLTIKLQTKEKQIKEKDDTINLLNSRINGLETNMKDMVEKLEQKPQLAYSRSNIHFIYFPKFSQRYEVSVQTDAVEYHVPSNNFSKVPQTAKIDRQMSQIEEKLSKLNQFKKPSKEKTLKIQEYPTKFEKADAIFSKIDDKENMMRLSNTFERLSNIPEQRIREQTIQIMPVHIDQMERLIRTYME